jgi:hypothetical protein
VAPFALLGFLGASAVLTPVSPLYAAVFIVQVTTYALAVTGWLLGERLRSRMTTVPLLFVMLNSAALLGLMEFVRLRAGAEPHRLWIKP